MGFNPEKDAEQKAATIQKILEAGFHIFAERTIEQVKMTDVADAAGIGVATVYRHFTNKPRLVVAVSVWAWERYLKSQKAQQPEGGTAAEDFAFFLDSFLDLYRNHRDILRFNQFFNVYVQSEEIPMEQMEPYMLMIRHLIDQFHKIVAKGQADATLCTEMSEQEMIATVIHLMLAAVTRYAVGLVYTDGSDPERELLFLRDMLTDRFTPRNNSQNRT